MRSPFLTLMVLVLSACTLTQSYPPPALEICDNGIDDDFDDQIDCADLGCFSRCHETRDACGDGDDDDDDMLVDCADPDCDPTCGEGPSPTCTDGRDNDADGVVDYLDPFCWSVADVRMEGCSTIHGENVSLGATPGLDWLLADDPAVEMTVVGAPALVAPPGGTSSGASRVIQGATADTAIDVRVVYRMSDTTVRFTLVLAPPSRLATRIEVRVAPEMVTIAAEGLSGLSFGSMTPVGAWEALSFHLAFSADGLSVSLPDGPSFDVPFPSGWGPHEPLRIGWTAEDGTGIAGVDVMRPEHDRCGVQSFGSMLSSYRVAAAVWAPREGDDEICVATRGALWFASVAGSSGDLPDLAIADDSAIAGRMVALAWDPIDAVYRGISQDQPIGPPGPVVSYASPSCSGPWTEVGEISRAAGISVRALIVGATEDTIIGEDSTGSLVTIVGQASVPSSFDMSTFGATVGEAPVAVASFGDDALLLRPSDGELAILAGISGGGAASVLATGGEPGTFDRFGFAAGDPSSQWPVAALAMEPITDPMQRLWSGLLVYEGCATDPCRTTPDDRTNIRLGTTWLRVARP